MRNSQLPSTTNEDGTMAKEQSELMNSKSANLLKETFKILSDFSSSVSWRISEKPELIFLGGSFSSSWRKEGGTHSSIA